MNILSVSLLAALLLTLNGCGENTSGNKTEAPAPVNTSKRDSTLEKLQKEAEAGNADAQNNLGWIYSNGHGSAKDDQAAIKWFRLAAAQGNANSQLALGKMYRSGQGVTQDNVRALMWFNFAADKGNADALQVRALALGHMTPDQIAEAKKMALECTGSNFSKCG
jgi:hypothetical protein